MYRQFSILMLFCLTAALPVQAKDWFPNIFGGSEEEIATIWQAGQQYIKIVVKEKSAEIDNEHPADISVEKLRDALSAMNLAETGGIFSDETKESSFFAQTDLSTLSSGLSRAFERAKPNEDVVFVVIGRHKGFVAKERKVIAGRAFMQNGKLNLIFGDVYRAEGGTLEQRNRNMAAGCGGCDDQDIRTNPYIIGYRNNEHSQKVEFADVEGLEKVRSDWLMLEIDTLVAAVEKERNKLPPALEREKARARKEAAQLSQERREMREEMARMRQEMKNGGGDISSQSLEERLATLKQLRRKELISDEEYQIKRKEILNDI